MCKCCFHISYFFFKKVENPAEPVSLLSSAVLDEFVAQKPQVAGVVSWSPPQPNWNAWAACNIDEGLLATVRTERISLNIVLPKKKCNNLCDY